MKRSWHERSGGAPDADTPVGGRWTSSPSCSSPHRHHPHTSSGVAVDMEEVRECRGLGLDLPFDCSGSGWLMESTAEGGHDKHQPWADGRSSRALGATHKVLVKILQEENVRKRRSGGGRKDVPMHRFHVKEIRSLH